MLENNKYFPLDRLCHHCCFYQDLILIRKPGYVSLVSTLNTSNVKSHLTDSVIIASSVKQILFLFS